VNKPEPITVETKTVKIITINSKWIFRVETPVVTKRESCERS
jgi:hypothetical protein